MHIAICDDNIDELSRISSQLEKYRSHRGNSVTYEIFHSVTELLETMKSRQYDLLLLDIIMPKITGIEAAREIRLTDKQIPIIFLTSSSEFAVESYRVSADNYIMKPVQTEELFPALDKILNKLSFEEHYVTLKTGDNVVRLPFSQIMFVEVQNRKVYFTLTTGEVKETRGNLSDFEKQLLLESNFIKPHRSYIVNLRQVTALDKTGFTTTAGKKVPVSRDLFVQTKTVYMKYLIAGKGYL